MQAENLTVVSFNKKRLLIVDDEPTILSLFSLMFDSNKDKLEVVTSDSIASAINEYRKQKFDLVILDHNLPRATGITFIKETNANNIFYFSGNAIHPESVWPYKDNIIDIFQKPDTAEIYKSVIEFLGLEYKLYKSKIKLATTTEKERSDDSFKSSRQYRRDFKKQFGTNENEYIKGEDGLKIKIAKKLLKEQMAVLAVSIILKYKHRRNFQAFFKNKTRITPAEYRKQFK